jgi:hypothetical protein
VVEWNVADAPSLTTDVRRVTKPPANVILHLERRCDMPVIARFYGILIKMYFREHGVPHFHAIYGEFNGVFDVTSIEMIEGDLPPRAQRLVRDWAEKYKNELESMWETQDYKALPGLE